MIRTDRLVISGALGTALLPAVLLLTAAAASAEPAPKPTTSQIAPALTKAQIEYYEMLRLAASGGPNKAQIEHAEQQRMVNPNPASVTNEGPSGDSGSGWTIAAVSVVGLTAATGTVLILRRRHVPSAPTHVEATP